MKSALDRWLQPITLVVVGGLLISIAAFSVTSYENVPKLIGPLGEFRAYPGFDPWTGLPHGWVIDVGDPTTGEIKTIEPMPPDMVGRRAAPLPVGFAVGALVTIGVLAVRSRKARSTRCDCLNMTLGLRRQGQSQC